MKVRTVRNNFPLDMHVWTGEAERREKEWLGKSWHSIKQKFPVDSAEDLAKAELGLRAISLTLIYLEFCHLAWDLESEPLSECEDWAKKFGIDHKILVQLAKSKGHKITKKELDEWPDLFAETLLEMADDLREEVFDTLCPVFNDYPEMIEGLAAIKDPSESSDVSDKVCSWFSEKCPHSIPY